MNLKMEDVIRAISEEKDAWDRMVRNLPRGDVTLRSFNEKRRDAVGIALLNVITRVSEIAEEEA